MQLKSRGTRSINTKAVLDVWNRNLPFMIGIDYGIGRDYSVEITINSETREIVNIKRFIMEPSWHRELREILEACNREYLLSEIQGVIDQARYDERRKILSEMMDKTVEPRMKPIMNYTTETPVKE